MPHPGRFPLLLGALALGLAPVARAQEPEAVGTRPRIALVLSGGGARGAAHVGILEALEELRVPVDVVVGTSMGAIVGGLYAAGYAPEEMARIIETADWGTLLSYAPPRDRLWFRRRQDERRFQVDLELGWADGAPVLPPGLILGRNIESFLERLTLPVAGVGSFDRLRIPFRCVATDLADGSAVVFADGSLAQAMRASLSLPGVFAPVERDGRRLVDGGAVDNIPVDVARGLGADVVIVVDISTPIGTGPGPDSPLGVSNQVIKILMANNRRRAMELLRDQDIAITPDLKSVTVLGFDQAAEAIGLGRAAAEEFRGRLAALGVGAAEWEAFLARQRRPPSAPLRIRHLTIERRTRLSERVLLAHSALHEGGPLDERSLRETRESLAGLGLFESIEIDVEPVPGSAGEADVILRPIEKPWGPHYLRFGLGLSSDLGGGGEVDLGVQHTWTPLNALGGEWRNEVQFGTRTRLFTEFYQPLDPGLRWFVAPSIEFAQDNLPLVVDQEEVAEVSVEALRASVAVGRNLGSFGELRVSYGWLTGTARPEIALPGLLPAKTDVSAGELRTSLSIDTLDSLTFPERGLVGGVEWKLGDSLIDEGRTSVVQALLGAPVSSGNWTVFPSLEGGLTLDGEVPLGGEFRLGGFRRLSGLAPGEISGNHYALAVLQSDYQLSERTSRFGMARYLGASLEYGGLWQERDDFDTDALRLGGSLYLGFDTLLGPAYLGFGLTEGGERSAYVFIGPVF